MLEIDTSADLLLNPPSTWNGVEFCVRSATCVFFFFFKMCFSLLTYVFHIFKKNVRKKGRRKWVLFCDDYNITFLFYFYLEASVTRTEAQEKEKKNRDRKRDEGQANGLTGPGEADPNTLTKSTIHTNKYNSIRRTYKR